MRAKSWRIGSPAANESVCKIGQVLLGEGIHSSELEFGAVFGAPGMRAVL